MTQKELYESGYKVVTCRPICDKSADIILETIDNLREGGEPEFTIASDLKIYTPFASTNIEFNHSDIELLVFYKEQS